MGLLSALKRARARVQSPPAGARSAAALPAGLHAAGAPFAQQPMNLIQVPDLSRKLVTRYGLREKAPAPTLATEVVPVVLVDDLIGESDLIRPRIRPAAGWGEAVMAAQHCTLGLFNPPGSRVVLHLYYFLLTNSTIGLYNLHFTGTPTTGAPSNSGSGFRNGLMPGASPAGRFGASVTGGPAPPGGSVEAVVRLGSNLLVTLPFDCVIDEGQGVQLATTAAITSTLYATAVWTEEDKQ